MSGLQGGVKIVAMMPYNALCSQTSALERKRRMLSRLGEEWRNPS
jgi:hypothetical protein